MKLAKTGTMLFALLLAFSALTNAFGQSIESQLRQFAARQYPNDSDMQAYVVSVR